MKNVVLAILLGWSAFVFAQDQAVSGIVSLEGEEVIGAYIHAVEADVYAVSETDGSYTLSLPRGSHTLVCSYIGAKEDKKIIEIADNDIRLDFLMVASSELISEVTISAKSEKALKEEDPLQIESVTIEQVASSVKDLTEAIDQLSGVRVRSTGSLGASVDIALNGLNGTAVRTFLDGMPLEFIYPSANLGNLPLDNIKRVDVYKGIVPVDIGTDAMGGGINLVTEVKNFDAVKASYGYGSFNTHQVGLNTNYGLSDHLYWFVNGNYNYSDNDYAMDAYVWEDREDKEVRRFNDAYNLKFIETGFNVLNQPWADRSRWSVSYIDYYKELQNGGAIGKIAYGNTFYKGDNKNVFSDIQKSLGENIDLRNSFSYGVENIAFIDTSYQKYSWSGEVVGRSPRAGEFSAATAAKRKQVSITDRFNINVDLGYDTDLVISNLIAYQDVSGRDTLKPLERDILTLPQKLTKNISGAELKRAFFNESLQLSAAGKYYYYHLNATDKTSLGSIDKKSGSFGYYASAKYQFNDDIFMRASYERALRIPTHVQFFGNGVNIIANPALKPETSDNYNIGLAYSTPAKDIRLQVNAFSRGQNDIIFLTSSLRQQYLNTEEVSTKGIEGELSVDFLDHFNINLNVTKLRKVYESIDSAQITNQFLVGSAFPNTPTLFGNVRLSYNLSDAFGQDNSLYVYTQYKYVDEFNFLDVAKIRSDENWVPLQHRVDAGIRYNIMKNRYSISVNVNNILNRKLYDNFKIPRPGRNYNLKFVYHFKNL